jgi:hypothetical protein
VITRELLIESLVEAAFTSPQAKKLIMLKLKQAVAAGDDTAVALLQRLRQARADRAMIKSGGDVGTDLLTKRLRGVNRYQYRMNRQAVRVQNRMTRDFMSDAKMKSALAKLERDPLQGSLGFPSLAYKTLRNPV